MSLDERFEKHVGRSGSYRDVTITGSDGNWLIDANGDRVVDFVAGWCVVNAGYGRSRINEAAHEAAEQVAYVKPVYRSEPVVALAETLADITPGDLSHTFRFTSGTESVETALKAARAYTGRDTIVANADAYHGTAYGAMALGDFSPRYGSSLPNVTKIASPSEMDHDEWIDRFAEICEQQRPAAYITETILTHQGVYVPDEAHYRDVRRICDEHDVLLIFDEVANGFGRTGRMFAADHYDVAPDMMTVAKGFSSGYAPIGAMITTQEIGQEVSAIGGTYSTFGWTPAAVAAARENIAVLQDEDLPSQARETGEQLASQVEAIDGVTGVNQVGLLLGVELADATAKDVRETGIDHGVLTGTTNRDDVLLLSPPLNIDDEYLEEGVDRLADAIRVALD